MRVALTISGLAAGGAERVMTLLAGALVARDHEVWLVTLERSGKDFYALDPRIRRLGLGTVGIAHTRLHGVYSNARRVYALRRALAAIEPHAVVSFVTGMNILTILACVGRSTRLIVSERVDPRLHREGRAWMLLRSVLYRRADVVVVQTQSIADWFRLRLWGSVALAVIPNPVSPSADPAPCTSESAPFILAAGRLTYQKGFDLLLRAFAATAANLPQLRLVIAGEGPDSQNLRDLAVQLGVGARVSFPGQVRGLTALMKAAVAFILPSRYEGFPNVLLEALAVGVPCVAVDCPGGAREILADGEYGILVALQDLAGLSAAIERVATDQELRQRLSQRAAAAVDRYRLDRVASEWEQLLWPPGLKEGCA